MANPFLFLAPLNGTLAFQDRAGGGTLTGAGAVRYQAASGARTNYAPNPTFATNTNGWVAEGSAAIPRITTDGALSGTCSEVTCTASTSDGIGTTGASGNFRVGGPGVYKISFYAKVVSGATDFVDRTLEYRADGVTNIGSNNSATDMTFTTSWARYSHTITTIRTGVHYLTYGILRKTAAVSVVRFSNFQCESGSTATDYFDGTTGAWLDPITGILGTAHASPSVSQAAAWVEEGTTNTVPDPSFEAATITTSWTTGASATISKVTTHAYIGSNAAKVVCTASTSDSINQLAALAQAASNGQAWTAQARVRAFAAGDVGKTVKLSVSVLDAGRAGLSDNQSSAITLTDAWQLCTFTHTIADATAAYARVRVVNGAAVACDFVVDAVQLEQKAYATSYCDGAIGTGYAWSGTAHASSSTRTATTISVSETNRINSLRGSWVSRVSFLQSLVAASGVPTVLMAGTWGGASRDEIGIRLSSSKFNLIITSNGTTAPDAVVDTGSLAVSTWYTPYADWNGTVINLAGSSSTLVAGTRAAPSGDISGDDLSIGSAGATLGAGQIGGLINNVAIFDRPLTTKERAKLYALTSWAWGTLRGGRVGLLMPR